MKKSNPAKQLLNRAHLITLIITTEPTEKPESRGIDRICAAAFKELFVLDLGADEGLQIIVSDDVDQVFLSLT